MNQNDDAAPLQLAVRLLPCPFCGETPNPDDPLTFQMNQGDKWGFVVCCCQGPEVRTEYHTLEHWKQKAIDAWNTRA
jgi:Lar family restriction alleviation protein